LDKAISLAVDNVKQQVNESKGMTYKITTVEENTMTNDNGVSSVNYTSKGVITATGESFDLKLIVIEKYWEQIQRSNTTQYECAVLVRVPKQAVDSDLPLYESDNSSIWRSALYPGWGQLYNKRKAKGFALLCTETALVGGIVIGQVMYSANIDKANQTTNQNRKIYLDNADSWSTVRNMCAIAAGAMYIYNLIDIFAADKPKLYSMNQRNGLRLYPYVTDRVVGAGIIIGF